MVVIMSVCFKPVQSRNAAFGGFDFAYHLGLFLQIPPVMPASYYDVLNVRYDATPEELKRA